ncbi:aminotransferase class I/II-fold pyridoxal phosphate-dependent enzyme [Fulvivirga ulvae]|uniref:pyridoxal phosphate-dependent decarboxylase family protein n=1 Tax=Fulvivirga ulvae TaxID=2904245 RepID=UPI001F1990DF|nr:aminotransferase class I/II-fold pyridoxal phosphate-dependent enzyme [Fulvivirga ulvae]UII29999.1 aminotransferase class I/II-fold pyridoxal phosphate-dependent enzyme [Fulvivirga ulvae]
MKKNKSLDYPLGEFSELLQKTGDIIIDRYHDLDAAKAYSGLTPKEVESWFNESVPENGMDARLLLNQVKEKVVDTATLNIGTNMYAYVMAGGTQVSVLAEMLVAAINQNVGKWHLAPVMSELEKRVVQWGGQFIGYDAKAGGVLVSGGSAANLTGLTVARNIMFEKDNIRKYGTFGLKPFTVYASDETHGCIDKSIELLGIGTDNFKKIKSLSDFTIDLQSLENQIGKDIQDGKRPFCIIGNAGTVNTGAIDPLDKLAAIANKYDMWFHVDGAYGGLAASIESLKEKFKGLDLANSVAIDFHKWLYQPFEAGCTLVKDWTDLNRTFYKRAAYLDTDSKTDNRFDFNEHHFQLSRSAKALKIWMSFKAYGSLAIKTCIHKDILLTKYLADQIKNSNNFALCNNPDLSVVCFRYLPGDKSLNQSMVDELNKRIIPELEADGRVFITGTTLNNRPVIRACLINHRLQKENVDFLMKVIREVGTKVTSKLTVIN